MDSMTCAGKKISTGPSHGVAVAARDVLHGFPNIILPAPAKVVGGTPLRKTMSDPMGFGELKELDRTLDEDMMMSSAVLDGALDAILQRPGQPRRSRLAVRSQPWRPRCARRAGPGADRDRDRSGNDPATPTRRSTARIARRRRRARPWVSAGAPSIRRRCRGGTASGRRTACSTSRSRWRTSARGEGTREGECSARGWFRRERGLRQRQLHAPRRGHHHRRRGSSDDDTTTLPLPFAVAPADGIPSSPNECSARTPRGEAGIQRDRNPIARTAADARVTSPSSSRRQRR